MKRLLISLSFFKDRIYDTFYKNGDFNATGIKKLDIKKPTVDLYLSLFWILLILPVSIYYILKILWFGSIYFKFGFIVLIISSNIK